MYWWQHNEKMPAASSGKIQRGFVIRKSAKNNETADVGEAAVATMRPSKFDDYDITWKLDGCVEPEIF